MTNSETLDYTVCIHDRFSLDVICLGNSEYAHPIGRMGRAKYNLRSDLELWFPDGQEKAPVKCRHIYRRLIKDGVLADQVGLTDLVAIQDKGFGVFHDVFGDKIIIGWKGVVRVRYGFFFHYLKIPCLYPSSGLLVLSWLKMGDLLDEKFYALRFRKRP